MFKVVLKNMPNPEQITEDTHTYKTCNYNGVPPPQEGGGVDDIFQIKNSEGFSLTLPVRRLCSAATFFIIRKVGNKNTSYTTQWYDSALHALLDKKKNKEKENYIFYLNWCSRSNFPFRKQAFPFLREVNWKCFYCKKEIHHRESNSGLYLANLSPLPLHHHANPPELQKI